MDLSNQKLTDWPAYKHSKSKTVSGFQKDYISIPIRGANESNMVLIIAGHPSNDDNLTINSSVSFYADKEEIGSRVEQVYQATFTGRLF